MSTEYNEDEDLAAASAALLSLVESNIPPDIQELLIYGDPERGIRPGALSRVVKAVVQSYKGLPQS